MILQTNLDHVSSEAEFHELVKNSPKLMICCGRMGPMCVPVYAAMSELRNEYPGVGFRDLAFDAPYAHVVRNMPEVRGFMGLPFIVYYKDGRLVAASSGIQTKAQVKEVLEREFGK